MLPLDLASLRDAARSGRAFDYRFFWGHRARSEDRVSDACFSQWWPATFTIDRVTYASAEHYMMAEKARTFGDTEALEKILLASEPADAKRLGRAVTGFDDEVWARVRFDIVSRASLNKFGQNAALGSYLNATGSAILVEASPVDCVWGIGLAFDHPDARNPERWRGENLLGFALTKARATLRLRLENQSEYRA